MCFHINDGLRGRRRTTNVGKSKIARIFNGFEGTWWCGQKWRGCGERWGGWTILMMNCYAGSGNVDDVNVHEKVAEVVNGFGSCAAGEGCEKNKIKHAGAF